MKDSRTVHDRDANPFPTSRESASRRFKPRLVSGDVVAGQNLVETLMRVGGADLLHQIGISAVESGDTKRQCKACQFNGLGDVDILAVAVISRRGGCEDCIIGRLCLPVAALFWREFWSVVAGANGCAGEAKDKAAM